MRKIVTIGLGLAALTALSSQALAVDKCHIPPPKWWFAPKVTYTYSGRSYASSNTSHTFSAQRRVSYNTQPRYRESYSRW